MPDMCPCQMVDRTTYVILCNRTLVRCNNSVPWAPLVHLQRQYHVDCGDSLVRIVNMGGPLPCKYSFLVWVLTCKSGSLVKNWGTPNRRPRGCSLRYNGVPAWILWVLIVPFLVSTVSLRCYCIELAATLPTVRLRYFPVSHNNR